jgi:hypothetical protein
VETQTIRGQWTHEGEHYRDDLVRAFADVADCRRIASSSRHLGQLKAAFSARHLVDAPVEII